MENLFMSRASAIALLIGVRRELLDHQKENGRDDVAREALDRLILDVRANRVDIFELRFPAVRRVTVL